MTSKFHVGQKVWLSNWRLRHKGQWVEIAKIGRKYASVPIYSREYKFDLTTGQAPDESGYFIQTDADLTAERAMQAAYDRLREVGWRHTSYFPRGLSADALNRIADVVIDDLNSEQ